MTPSPWAELVITPRLWWAGGAEVQPYEPFEVTKTIRIGPKGSDAELVWDERHSYELGPGPGGLMVKPSAQSVAKFVTFGTAYSLPAIQLRALSSPQDSAGWPTGLARPRGPWSDETLSVLADQLLERGRDVGQRFLTPDPKSDGTWIPVFAGRRVDPMSWRRGVVDTAAFSAPSTWEFGRALALQAVTTPLRELQLRFRSLPDYTALLIGLIDGGGLPCLERLTFSLEGDSAAAAIAYGTTGSAPELAEDLRKLPGFGGAFPVLGAFEVAAIHDPRPHQAVG